MSADISEQPDPHRAAGPTRDPTPRVIKDRYQVIRGLGKGSSAETLLCLDLQEDRRVAVKELHFQHLDDWKHLDLFAREARVMAMLDHRGIPKVFEFLRDQGEEATLFLVQEYVEGVSLEGRMVEGPLLGEEEVFDLTLGLLDVLEYLHSRTPPVLHRDIKPSNILVRDDGSPVLIDFGGVCFGWRPPDHTGTTVGPRRTSGHVPPRWTRAASLVGELPELRPSQPREAPLLRRMRRLPGSDLPGLRNRG